ncbi:MAG: hypothetical protein AAF907_02210, partial [Planctomycetota bacterium]
SVWPPAIGLAAACSAGFLVWLVVHSRRHNGRYDLIVDRERRVLALPITRPRDRRALIPFREVHRIRVVKEAEYDEADQFPVFVELSPAEAARHGLDRSQPVYPPRFGPVRRSEADRLARWIRREVEGRPGESPST